MSTRTIPYVDLARQHQPIKQEILSTISRCLDKGDFILGEAVAEFENRVANYCGTRFAVGVNSGTDALFLTLKAYGIGQGDEVITAPNSFLATASVIVAAGAQPVFVDVRDDMNINPDLIEKKVAPRTKAIIPVHLTGKPSDMEPIMEIARAHHLRVIEDSAQAIGAEYKGEKVGSISDAGCFSLHPLKTLNACGDAGVITTNDENLNTLLRQLRNIGLKNRDESDVWGYNSRLDSIQAAILLVKLNYLDAWTEKRRKNAAFYLENLQTCTGIIKLPHEEKNERSVYHTFVIQAKQRNELKNYLEQRDIGTRIHYPIPIHLQKASAPLGLKRGDFPVCERLADTILSLPIYPELTEDDLAYVCEMIKEFYRKATP